MESQREIAEAEAKLDEIEVKLIQIEELKAMEPKLRREAAALTEKIGELRSAAAFYAPPAQDEEEEEEEEEAAPARPAPAAPAVREKQPPTAPKERDDDEQRKAQMRAINKKLKQIDALKSKDNHDADAKKKLALEPKLRRQLACLERGETYVDSDAEKVEEEPPQPPIGNFKPAAAPPKEVQEEAKSLKLPTDKVEVEKRVKALNKKLQQIEKLKEKEGALDEEARQKISSESEIQQELAALREGKDEVIFVVKTLDEQKFEIEKKLKALHKKLDAIKKLKETGNLDADAKAKVDSEKALNKDAHNLQLQINEINQQERRRVSQRLGWESEEKPTATKKGKQ